MATTTVTTRKARKVKVVPQVVVVYDVYPGCLGSGEQGYKRATWTFKGQASAADWREIWFHHGSTDLRYSVLEGGRFVRGGRFDNHAAFHTANGSWVGVGD